MCLWLSWLDLLVGVSVAPLIGDSIGSLRVWIMHAIVSFYLFPSVPFYVIHFFFTIISLIVGQIKCIKFTEFNNGVDPELNPVTVHLFVNRENLGFEDIADVDPTQTLTLTAEELRDGSDPIALKFVKFQRVKTVTFFFEDNAGGDVTALGSLKLMGRAVVTTNMKDFKKNPQPM
jgi:hypothetical protein